MAAISGRDVANISLRTPDISSRPSRRAALAGDPAAIGLAALMLLWPAFWNGYPLVFSDTGTYLTQTIDHYLGWDRPVFYSLFLYPLHLQQTLWPPVVAQAVLAAWLLHLLRRVLLPESSTWVLLALVVPLTALTALPVVVSQLMPDVFTSLLVIAIALTVLTPELLSRGEARLLLPASSFMIAVHQSNIPLSLALLLVLLPLRRVLGAAPGPLRDRMGWLWRALLPWPFACVALISVNLIGHDRASLSPFGDVFLLTRLIYDGPGLRTLQRDCPQSGWRLCTVLGRLPPNSDDFLWRRDSPLVQAGGAKAVSGEAWTIILATIREDPGAVLRGFVVNAVVQFGRFATGDGLQPWPETVTPVIVRDFPRAEAQAYAAARQQRGDMGGLNASALFVQQGHGLVPGPLIVLHMIAAIAGIAGAVWVLFLGLRRHHVAAGFAAASLLGVLINAAITGGLSGPHDRYQSRIIWLPLAVALLAAPALVERRSAMR